ncbi:MAG: amino acid transport protein [Candidatus Riflebacteria bacterium]|nr:amino acid transport protein [Candidatus Riflebacteria bacterium]
MDSEYLMASMIWGTVGFGFFIYGKKQVAAIPMLGGALIMGYSYLIEDAMSMSLATIVTLGAMYWISTRS